MFPLILFLGRRCQKFGSVEAFDPLTMFKIRNWGETMIEFIQQLVNGIHVGSIYALIALGYTMVYGIVRLINFAHGDILMMGAYFGIISLTRFKLPLPEPIGFLVTVIISMVVCGIIGMVIDRVAYKPLRNAPRISALITALGVSLFLENLFMVIFSATPRRMPTIEFFNRSTEVFGVRLTMTTGVTIVLMIVSMLALEYVVHNTKIGKAMRAVSEDKHAARLMGINVDRVISITFAIGSALGGLGGVLYSVAYPQVEPLMGVMPGLKAFVAAVLGGIGILPGAMLGGFLMGIIESLSKGYIETLTGGILTSSWSNGIVFAILIVVLLVKPSGIMGKNVSEKV